MLPGEVRADLDSLAKKRSRSHFITDAVRKALRIARQRRAVLSVMTLTITYTF